MPIAVGGPMWIDEYGSAATADEIDGYVNTSLSIITVDSD